MDRAKRDFIVKVLDASSDLTLATNRPDGWPQATVASFVHDGLTLYIGCSPEGQKAKNVERDKRVSITVTAPYRNWHEIMGVSMAAEGELVKDGEERARIGALMTKRFGDQIKDLPPIEEAGFAFIRMRPKVISILDYTRGFGHTELIEVARGDLA